MAGAPKPENNLIFFQQLGEVLNYLNIGVYTVDNQRRITFFSRAAELLTGFEAKDVMNRYCHEVFLNDLCQAECRFHEAVEAEQKSLSFEVEITDRHGEKHLITKIVSPLFDINRNLTGCIEVFQDHSAFEELINRIRYDERQLKIILENLDIGVFTTTRGGHITFFNRLAEAISGHNRKEVLGKPSTLVLGSEESDDTSLLNKSISDGKHRSNSKGLLTTKGGKTIPMRANYMALRNEQGRIVGGLATMQDLSLIHQLNRAIKNRYTFDDMIGKGPSMQKIFEIVSVVAPSNATILIEGATGTGKDLLAKVVHNASNRAGKPMVKVNCAALPDNLLESEMFGYVKGAFTGADRDKSGRFQEADDGTIFLDEIGDLPLPLQAKLLRVLEDQEFYPLGSRKTTKVDVRIIAATNQGLEKQVKRKRFRKDLFYRLNVIGLELPTLKERKEDIPLLIGHIMKCLSPVMETQSLKISEDAMEILLNYDYPGNIRELENILEHASIICQNKTMERRHLPLFLQKSPLSASASEAAVTEQALTSQEADKHLIQEMLKRNNWNRKRTAIELHIDRTTLWRKMKKYGLSG
ncbi:MAG: PAS domain S-box protein [Deltaproteobacteria bacterium]|nr:PAS domain S-box protein [Deltaproteobacteria bacterium]